jgi:hypothetical protein
MKGWYNENGLNVTYSAPPVPETPPPPDYPTSHSGTNGHNGHHGHNGHYGHIDHHRFGHRSLPRGYSAVSGYSFNNEPLDAVDVHKPLLPHDIYTRNAGPEGAQSPSRRVLTKTLLSLNDFNENYMKNLSFFSMATLIAYLVVCIFIVCVWFDLTFVNSAYFTVITLATVGFGDFVPKSQTQQLFVTAMILVGLAIGSFLVSSLSEVVYDHNERMTQQRNIRTEQQLHDAIVRRRYRKVRRGANSRSSSRAVSFDGNEDVFVVKSGVSGIRLHVPVSEYQRERIVHNESFCGSEADGW